jgi:hypothetical protein
MTLKRLMIVLAVLVFLAGVGIAWFWQYAYSPPGRARVIIAQLKGDTTSIRGWLLQHHLVRSWFAVPPEEDDMPFSAESEMCKLGGEALPVAIEARRGNNRKVRWMAIKACGEFQNPIAIKPLANYMRNPTLDPPGTSPDPIMAGDQDLQVSCLLSLIDIGPESYGSLKDASNGCPPEVRRWIPDMIGNEWDDAAIPHLVELLDDSDHRIRAGAARKLADFHDKRGIPTASKLLDDPDWVVRELASDALKKLGVKPPPATQPDEQ